MSREAIKNRRFRDESPKLQDVLMCFLIASLDVKRIASALGRRPLEISFQKRINMSL